MRAGQGRGHVVGGRQARRRLGQGRQQRRFGEAEGAGGLAEIGLRRRLHAIGAVAEEDAVQVELEDLVLAEPIGEAGGHDRLLHLALDRPVGGQEQGLGQLLGQARPALHGRPGRGVRPEGAQHPQPVDGPVLVEAPVLRRQEGARHIGGQLPQGDAPAVAGAAHGDGPALAVQEGHAGRAVQRPQSVRRGDLGQARQPGQLDPGAGQDDQQQQGHAHGHADPHAPRQRPPPGRQVGAESRHLGWRVWEPVGHSEALVKRPVGFRTP